MTDRNSKRNKHITLDDQMKIQSYLDHGMAFKGIAKHIF